MVQPYRGIEWSNVTGLAGGAVPVPMGFSMVSPCR